MSFLVFSQWISQFLWRVAISVPVFYLTKTLLDAAFYAKSQVTWVIVWMFSYVVANLLMNRFNISAKVFSALCVIGNAISTRMKSSSFEAVFILIPVLVGVAGYHLASADLIKSLFLTLGESIFGLNLILAYIKYKISPKRFFVYFSVGILSLVHVFFINIFEKIIFSSFPGGWLIFASIIVFIGLMFAVKIKLNRSRLLSQSAKNKAQVSSSFILPAGSANKDRDRLAIRTAATALLHAASGSNQSDVVFSLRSASDSGSPYYWRPSPDMNVNRWNMLMCLSAKISENIKYGNSSINSAMDYKAWHSLAKIILGNGGHGMYFPSPENCFEHNENKNLTEKLMHEQESMVFEYLSSNTNILEELSSKLLPGSILSKKDLFLAAKKSVVPLNFPQPL